MSETDPIKVYARDGRWQVNYGSYVRAWYETRSEAIRVARAVAIIECRELTIEPESCSPVAVPTTGSPAGDSIHWDA